MDVYESIILGIIQGFTEWLPISSSGHLVIAQEWLGLDVPVAFDVILHFATVFVIIIMFRKEILAILIGVFSPAPLKNTNNSKIIIKSTGQTTLGDMIIKYPYWKRVRNDVNALLGWWIIIGTSTTAVIGLFFRDIFASFFYSTFIVALALIVTGIVLVISTGYEKMAAKKRISVLDAFTIGLCQGFAIIPGISRSGMTIGIGMMRNIERETAAKYSILLAVPVIIGAAVWEIPNLFETGVNEISLIVMITGGVTAFIVGFIAIKLLLIIVKKAVFHYFAAYCFALAGILLVIV